MTLFRKPRIGFLAAPDEHADQPVLHLMRRHHRQMLGIAIASGVLTVGAAVTASISAIKAQSIACVTINKNYIMTSDKKTFYKVAQETGTMTLTCKEWAAHPVRPDGENVNVAALCAP